MEHLELGLRVAVAAGCGALIGMERQWHQRGAGLRTNVLVAVGACLFVLVSTVTTGDTSPTRIAAQVVSGVGFLGAGVIIRDGANVRGINTAATLWCAAAVGCLAAVGEYGLAIVGGAVVMAANLTLRPVARLMDRHSTPDSELYGATEGE
jgi:putative Mg2+ transporter-C (MgtC) family protein